MVNQKVKPKRIGLFQTIKNFPRFIHNPAIYFKNLLDQNDGLVEIQMPKGQLSVTSRPNIIKYILQQNHKNYIKPTFLADKLKAQIGNGLLTSEGEFWLKQRRAIQPGFHKKRLDSISKVMVSEINQYMDDVFDGYADSGEAIDLSNEMMHLAFKIVSKSLLGGTVNDKDLDAFNEIISNGQQFIVNQIRKPFLKPWYKINGAYKKNREDKKQGDALIIDIIKQRKASNKRHDDLLDLLLETKYEDGSGMTNQQLLDEAIILYVAGHETSGISLSWTWYLIATHPEIEEKLLQSVNNSIGESDPSFESLRSLDYSLQVVEESMRLYPPAWAVSRAALENDAFEGFNINKNQEILCLIYGVHHSSEYWNDPEKFDPERFTADNKKLQTPFSFMPFGGGPRLCIGNSFALMEMQLVLAMMIKRYKIEVMPDQDIDFNPLITLRPRNGIKVKVHKRK